MNDQRRESFSDEIERKQRRKQRAKSGKNEATWFGLGMFGLVGWSVSLPIVIGVLIGLWIDGRTASRISWTLMLLGAGVISGAVLAWYWIEKERNEMRRDDD